MTKTDVKNIRTKIDAALKKIAKEYNGEFSMGSIRYGATTLSGKLTFSEFSENKHGTYLNDKKALAFISKAQGLGLSSTLLNEPIKYNGNTYVITGYNTRAPKNPMNFTMNGEPYKSSVTHLFNIITKARPEYIL